MQVTSTIVLLPFYNFYLISFSFLTTQIHMKCHFCLLLYRFSAVMSKRAGYKRWSQEDLEAAMRRVVLGELSLRAASKQYGVPSSTLSDKMNYKSSLNTTQGPDPYLTHAEETKITDWAIHMARIGFGQSKQDIKNVNIFS